MNNEINKNAGEFRMRQALRNSPVAFCGLKGHHYYARRAFHNLKTDAHFFAPRACSAADVRRHIPACHDHWRDRLLSESWRRLHFDAPHSDDSVGENHVAGRAVGADAAGA